MEAMWTRFLPAVARLRSLVADGAIGEVLHVSADFGFAAPYDPRSRLFAVETGGGALLDLAVYPVSFAQMLLGAPSSVHAVGALAPTGVESSVTLLLGWEDGRSATLGASLRAAMPNTARVVGSQGWIDALAPFHRATHLVLQRPGEEPRHFDDPVAGAGYGPELAEVVRCVRAGATESAVMPLEDTVEVMAVIEEAAAQVGAAAWREASMGDSAAGTARRPRNHSSSPSARTGGEA